MKLTTDVRSDNLGQPALVGGEDVLVVGLDLKPFVSCVDFERS
jgi:hypothetical protein